MVKNEVLGDEVELEGILIALEGVRGVVVAGGRGGGAADGLHLEQSSLII